MTNAAQRVADNVRRSAILAILAFAPGQTATARCIRQQLEERHGQVLTVDKVRAMLLWLADVEAVEYQRGNDLDMARLTELGQDVLAGRSQLPGG